MTMLIVIAVLVFVVLPAAVVFAMSRAPEGIEDETGFHVVHR